MGDQIFLSDERLSENMEEDIFTHALSDHSSDMSSRQKEMEEIIVKEILPRLPTKTLLRFKSVSPNFKAHISSPFLVRLHFMHPKSLSGLFYHTENGIRYVSFDPPWSDLPDPSLSYLPELVSIKASTHGMLCVRGEYTSEYYITNPTTRKWVQLPQPAVKHPDDVAVVVAFEEPAVYNFGSVYRVVCIYPSKDQRVCIFETFSSDKWAWDRSEKTCEGGNIVAGSGTAVRGVAYWRTTEATVVRYFHMVIYWSSIFGGYILQLASQYVNESNFH
jgi:hypothetical protein